MKPTYTLVFALLLGFALSVPLTNAASAASAEEIDQDASIPLERLYKSKPNAKGLADQAVAILVFPKIVKAGLIIGGAYGEGVLRRGAKGFSPAVQIVDADQHVGAQARQPLYDDAGVRNPPSQSISVRRSDRAPSSITRAMPTSRQVLGKRGVIDSSKSPRAGTRQSVSKRSGDVSVNCSRAGRTS